MAGDSGIVIPMDDLKVVEFVHGLNAPRDVFLDNIRTNCARDDVPQFRVKRAVLVAGGPSAGDHLDDIRAFVKDGWELWCVNGAHDWLRSHGLRPSVCVVMDASPVVTRFVTKPRHGVVYMVASQVHPSLIDRLVTGGADVRMWHAALDLEAHGLMPANATITAPANTVGLHALQLMCLSGMRRVRVYGMDSSHRGEQDHAYDNSHQNASDEIEFFFRGKRYMATGTWAAQADMFAKLWPRFLSVGMMVEVEGDGLLPDMYRHLRAEFKSKEHINGRHDSGRVPDSGDQVLDGLQAEQDRPRQNAGGRLGGVHGIEHGPGALRNAG